MVLCEHVLVRKGPGLCAAVIRGAVRHQHQPKGFQLLSAPYGPSTPATPYPNVWLAAEWRSGASLQTGNLPCGHCPRWNPVQERLLCWVCLQMLLVVHLFHSLSLSICWRTRWPIRPCWVAYGADAVWKTKCLKKTKVTLPTLSLSYRFLCPKKKKREGENEKAKKLKAQL